MLRIRVSVNRVVPSLIALVVLAFASVASAEVIEVRPGDSIRDAVDRAVAGDTVRIFGGLDFIYNTFGSLVMKPGVTVEGVQNPIIDLRSGITTQADVVVMASGSTLRGATIAYGYPDPQYLSKGVRVTFDYSVQDAVIDGCTLLGPVSLYGSGNTIKNSVVRGGRGPAISMYGGNNSLIGNVVEYLGPILNANATTFQGAITVSSSACCTRVLGGNLFLNNTIVPKWTTSTSTFGTPVSSVGIFVYGGGGSGHRVVNTIVSQSGAGGVKSQGGGVDVSYSLLETGTTDPSVRLGDGVLVGLDPRFIDKAHGDYHLAAGSPAIDAGDPNSPSDSDGSRADMGAKFSAAEVPPRPKTIGVHPGDSIQAAVDRTVAGDTIRIFGQPGYVYREHFSLKESLTLEGVGNPVLDVNGREGENYGGLVLPSGVVLRGLTIVSKYPGDSELHTVRIFIFYDVQHVKIERCVILGIIDLKGSGNILQSNFLRAKGSAVSILGGNNYLYDNVIESLKPARGPLYGQGVVRVDSTSESKASGGNFLFGNTLVPKWLSVRGLLAPRLTYRSSGIHFGTGAGANNEVRDTILAKTGGSAIVNQGPQVLVRYSLLEVGLIEGDVLLGDGVLLNRDPMFYRPNRSVYRLKPGSPAIDSGDPQSPVDPDGSRADIGAVPFDHRTGS